MKSLFRDSTWVLLGQLVTSLTAFAVITVLANMLEPEDFGLYRFVLSVVTILAITNLPGLDTALVQSTAKGFRNSFTYVARTKAVFSLLGSLAACLLATYYWLTGAMLLASAFALVAIFLPLYGTFFIYFFYLQGRKEFGRAALIQAIGRVVFATAMIGFVCIFPSALIALFGFLAGTVLMQYAGYVWVLRQQKKRLEKPIENDPNIISYGKHLTLLGTANIIAVNIDKVITWYVLGPVATAIYTVATLLPLESIRIGRIMSQVLLPRFSENSTIDLRSFLKRIALVEIILFAGWLTFALVASFFFSLFFPDYAKSVPYAIVAGLIVLTAPAYIIRSYFTATKSEDTLKILLIGVPIIKTLLLVILIFPYGLWGAIWAMVIGGLLEIAISLYLFISHIRTQQIVRN